MKKIASVRFKAWHTVAGPPPCNVGEAVTMTDAAVDGLAVSISGAVGMIVVPTPTVGLEVDSAPDGWFVMNVGIPV